MFMGLPMINGLTEFGLFMGIEHHIDKYWCFYSDDLGHWKMHVPYQVLTVFPFEDRVIFTSDSPSEWHIFV